TRRPSDLVRLGEGAVIAKTGVVDQAVHLRAERSDPVEDSLGCPGLAQVLGHGVHGDALAELLRDGGEGACVARDEDEIPAIGRALTSELEPDPAARAGNERES